MSPPISVVALFCEDVREEKSGTRTLVGILPDNIAVTNHDDGLDDMARTLPKLCVYVRINFDPEASIGEPEMVFIMPDGTRKPLGFVTKSVVDEAVGQAKNSGGPLAGIISTAFLRNFKCPDAGSLRLEVTINGETHVAGALNFYRDPKPGPRSA